MMTVYYTHEQLEEEVALILRGREKKHSNCRYYATDECRLHSTKREKQWTPKKIKSLSKKSRLFLVEADTEKREVNPGFIYGFIWAQ